jgi:hypothetical protein
MVFISYFFAVLPSALRFLYAQSGRILSFIEVPENRVLLLLLQLDILTGTVVYWFLQKKINIRRESVACKT